MSAAPDDLAELTAEMRQAIERSAWYPRPYQFGVERVCKYCQRVDEKQLSHHDNCLVKRGPAAIESLQRQLSEARAEQVWGFYETEIPIYAQGPAAHELQSLVTAEECNGMAHVLAEAERQLSASRAEGERLRAALEAVANECDPDDPEWLNALVTAALSPPPRTEE